MRCGCVRRSLAEFQSRKARRVHLSDRDLLRYLGCIVLIALGYVLLWTCMNLEQVVRSSSSSSSSPASLAATASSAAASASATNADESAATQSQSQSSSPNQNQSQSYSAESGPRPVQVPVAPHRAPAAAPARNASVRDASESSGALEAREQLPALLERGVHFADGASYLICRLLWWDYFVSLCTRTRPPPPPPLPPPPLLFLLAFPLPLPLPLPFHFQSPESPSRVEYSHAAHTQIRYTTPEFIARSLCTFSLLLVSPTVPLTFSKTFPVEEARRWRCSADNDVRALIVLVWSIYCVMNWNSRESRNSSLKFLRVNESARGICFSTFLFSCVHYFT